MAPSTSSAHPARRAVLAALPLLALAPLARAQTLADIEQREAAVLDAWNKTPLLVRHAMFTTGEASGYGIYTPRPDGPFKPGEKLQVYCEPVGYGYKPNGAEWEFGFAVDFLVKSKDGNVLAGKEDFGRFVFHSHEHNREVKLTIGLSLTGAPPADYVLEIKLRDVTGPKSTSFDLPFTIAA